MPCVLHPVRLCPVCPRRDEDDEEIRRVLAGVADLKGGWTLTKVCEKIQAKANELSDTLGNNIGDWEKVPSCTHVLTGERGSAKRTPGWG